MYTNSSLKTVDVPELLKGSDYINGTASYVENIRPYCKYICEQNMDIFQWIFLLKFWVATISFWWPILTDHKWYPVLSKHISLERQPILSTTATETDSH